MLPKTLCMIVAISLLQLLSARSVLAQAGPAITYEKLSTANADDGGGSSGATKEARSVEKIKSAIARLGAGPDARIEVNLKDKRKLKGYVSEVGDDHFVVVDNKTGAATTVPYPQVRQVKGNNLSTGAKIAITIGVILALAALLAISGG
jgi:hypothetical protein